MKDTILKLLLATLWPVVAISLGAVLVLWLLFLWPMIITAKIVRKGNSVRLVLARDISLEKWVG